MRFLRGGGIVGFIIRRVLLGLVVLLLVSVIVFVSTQLLGDPARAILGRDATPDRLAALHKQLHLDSSKVGQYFHWLGGLLHGDLGTSLASSQPVTSVLGARLANSAVLVVLAAVVSVPISIAIGSYAALRRERIFDTVSSNLMLLLAALPEFVVAVLLVILLSTNVIHWLPATSPVPPGTHAWNYPSELIMPVGTLVIAVAPYVSRIMRASMIEVLESDYVEMARLKGLPERTVLIRHALPNAIGPVFQVIAINLAYLAGGVVVIESVFNYPGIGLALVDAVNNHDIPVVQALAMLIAAVYVVLNLLADVATILVTPRLRTRL
ncbi:MAG TPA: ABC transporter permease [Nocardioides sp.]|jgi:peptide/nickel transport system permease protein|uniref:ABC transporter permease n=1 Tax=Nocardioides sp. TaxID=35761 RepID=UPI002E34A75A|nr:ABC transporter permease [Nocardioides sp.]HEX3931704.1 ABC transporter permease [Nocardioides sp.]